MIVIWLIDLHDQLAEIIFAQDYIHLKKDSFENSFDCQNFRVRHSVRYSLKCLADQEKVRTLL